MFPLSDIHIYYPHRYTTSICGVGVNWIIYVPPQYSGTLILLTVYINPLEYTCAYSIRLSLDSAAAVYRDEAKHVTMGQIKNLIEQRQYI